ncbi:restriction endonuclease subunit S [Actinomyces sp. oral taxon 181]|uniref:restriction endonuclease subunit S n=1 Tax=Actinomyces sp. oral taxon 181 TaxID=712121 RepID=UPI0002A45A83|nr:restriction endonuclease subunit S [Actinomyces sp. oral taxon 181]EKY15810.1 type I restriction modification DNA specificity domain protein [Actinomyces sp. oral taxon 181 str. F0379]
MTYARVTIDDATALIIDHRGKTPKKLGADWTTAGHRVISALNIKGSRIDENDHHYVDSRTYANWMKVPLAAGDTLLTSEAPLGEVAYLQHDVDWVLGQRLYALRAKPSLAVGRFLFYALQSPLVRNDLESRATGTTVFGISQVELRKVQIPCPPIAVQRRIAGVLGALDDKIESNRKQQYIGERLLRALIERILCQFSEADSTTFDAYCTYSKESVLPENVGSGDKYIALEHMPRGSIFLNSWENAELAGIASNKNRFRQGDLLFGKLRPYFKKVGVAPVSGVCSTDILVIRPRLREFLPLITVVASSDALIDSISASATGTRMPRASWKDISAWPVPRIADETLIVLLQPANQLMAFLEALSFQNLKLTEVRDALLPELMSGQMRVDEAGRLVSEALDEEAR